jgi:hypothetical protein
MEKYSLSASKRSSDTNSLVLFKREGISTSSGREAGIDYVSGRRAFRKRI